MRDRREWLQGYVESGGREVYRSETARDDGGFYFVTVAVTADGVTYYQRIVVTS